MKKKNLTDFKVLGLVAVTFIFMYSGCGKKAPEITWNYSIREVIRPERGRSDSIHIDLYIDATKSMSGFAKNTQSIYNKFLEELETTVGVGWKSADIRFFKFGTKIKEIDRQVFRTSNAEYFYLEPGIFEKTNIDQVINQTDSSRLSVVITDLFQTEGDINSIVQQIKERCFKRGIQVAILGIKSEFDGWVYDVGPGVVPYKLKSTGENADTYRPFYALIFGDPLNIEQLFNNLKSQPFVKEENFLVLSRYLLNKVDMRLTKSRESRGLNTRSKSKQEQAFEIKLRQEMLFKFDMKKGNNEGAWDAEITFERNARTPDFRTEDIELVVYKKSSLPGQKDVSSDSILSDDITLNSVNRENGRLKASLGLKLAEPPGNYAYLVYLQCASIDGLWVPQWVRDFSSPNPSAKNDSFKTLNLEKFVNDLIRANLAIYQPKIAKMYITIRKL